MRFLYNVAFRYVGLRFDKKRKYMVEEGSLKVTVWEDSGMVYAMVI